MAIIAGNGAKGELDTSPLNRQIVSEGNKGNNENVGERRDSVLSRCRLSLM